MSWLGRWACWFSFRKAFCLWQQSWWSWCSGVWRRSSCGNYLHFLRSDACCNPWKAFIFIFCSLPIKVLGSFKTFASCERVPDHWNDFYSKNQWWLLRLQSPLAHQKNYYFRTLRLIFSVTPELPQIFCFLKTHLLSFGYVKRAYRTKCSQLSWMQLPYGPMYSCCSLNAQTKFVLANFVSSVPFIFT